MLHDPERHEALIPVGPWDARAARQAARGIALALLQARRADGVWPAHPRDLDGATPPPRGYLSLYLGSAGVLWALWRLQRGGVIDAADLRAAGVDIAEALARADADYQAQPSDSDTVVPSYYLGQSGILLLRWAVSRDTAVADRLFDVIRGNRSNPTLEPLWGTPGTLVPALHLWQATGDERWRRLLQVHMDDVWSTWQLDETTGAWLWTQDLYGKTAQYIGAGHGMAGNVYPLLRAWALLDDARRQQLVRRCEVTLQRLALRDGDAANWRPGTWQPRPGSPRALVQWCHGAPGIITSFSPLPVGVSPLIDELLVAGGHATWRAGPLAKGAGLCHGTAGNGWALLQLHRRTGHVAWLQRARAFAEHALGQQQQAQAQHGQVRASLWTGDAGLALFMLACTDGNPAWPTLDEI